MGGGGGGGGTHTHMVQPVSLCLLLAHRELMGSTLVITWLLTLLLHSAR